MEFFTGIIRTIVSFCLLTVGLSVFSAGSGFAQTAPRPGEVQRYTGLLAAVQGGDRLKAMALIKSGADINIRDTHGRTPLMLAAHNKDHAMARLLIKAGADVNALDIERYDVITISGVADDPEMIRIALAAGANAGLSTSPYDGTALIASAHLGRVEVVNLLIAAKAPLDHVNNLGWTALIEAIVLGDGGPDHTAIVKALIDAGADVNIADRQGETPLRLARGRGFAQMATLIEAAGGR